MSQTEMVTNGMSIPQEDRQSLLQRAADLDRTWDSRDARGFAALFDDNGDFRKYLCNLGSDESSDIASLIIGDKDKWNVFIPRRRLPRRKKSAYGFPENQRGQAQ